MDWWSRKKGTKATLRVTTVVLYSFATSSNSIFNQRDNCSVEEFSRGLKLSLPPLLVLPLLVLPLWLPWLPLLRTSSNFAHNLFNICMHAGLWLTHKINPAACFGVKIPCNVFISASKASFLPSTLRRNVPNNSNDDFKSNYVTSKRSQKEEQGKLLKKIEICNRYDEEKKNVTVRQKMIDYSWILKL